MSLFITCPVENVERATAFYTALGWTLDTEMSDHNVSCFAIGQGQYVMLGSREMYASVGGTEELIGGPDTPSKVTVSFDLGSREAEEPQRYSDLQRDLGVPTNMLATRLRELEAAGVLTRLPLRHNTRAYALTDRGLALRGAIVALEQWGRDAAPQVRWAPG
ncbi:hypothetical protein CH276_24295 [Rhodococcus sp. 06-470-2]|uniref:winged helix-turn-helix transcriptional regulator n=1 Tax=unclassified Rhodococcus (in: high G+C Gram-positive bacteria) TaxID=192944 RepID=UPI000B9B9E30|nr:MULTISPECIES: winged helix-turn-helix transcriptional regulator [unclassified Rhodococcus (in: high G+C Gram-positive bacteria)]OZC58070.1 hypothetical protein CH276_24295 [Rhodococcus sp. 06-470-2]OZE55082.1 hypothetical protein CH265_27850 [Rhodococcus sp. 05-2221-1B]